MRVIKELKNLAPFIEGRLTKGSILGSTYAIETFFTAYVHPKGKDKTKYIAKKVFYGVHLEKKPTDDEIEHYLEQAELKFRDYLARGKTKLSEVDPVTGVESEEKEIEFNDWMLMDTEDGTVLDRKE
jgi:uncharacterized protein YozE (UPF0346 family)